jgi:hypothetical protein
VKQRTCHYDQFSQIVRLQKAMSKQVLLYFNATLDTSDDGPRAFYCCWRRTFSITALLCNLNILIILVDGDV